MSILNVIQQLSAKWSLKTLLRRSGRYSGRSPFFIFSVISLVLGLHEIDQAYHTLQQ